MATAICNSAAVRLQFSSTPTPTPTFSIPAFVPPASAVGCPLRRSVQELRPLRRCQAGHRGFPSLRTRTLSLRCGATPIDQSDFPEKVLKSDVPVLVEFVANWCGPCRLIAPIVDWASQEYEDRLKVIKIDHDANPQLIEEYKVYGLPTLILFKDGQEVPESRREGAITKAKLKAYLDSLLESMAVA